MAAPPVVPPDSPAPSSGFFLRLTNAWNQLGAMEKFLCLIPLIVFAAATACALAGMFNTGYGWSEKWWLAAGWLLAIIAIMASAISAGIAFATADGSGVVPATLLMNIVTFIVSGFVVISFWTADSGWRWASGIIWSGACLALGGFSGFLFGIPRFRSEGRTRLGGPAQTNVLVTADGDQSKQIVVPVQPHVSTSTNDQSPIEQIADWLTKTIVGVALVNLEKMPGLLSRWAAYVSSSIGDPPSMAAACGGRAGCNLGPSFALGVIIYFTVVGFLSGYLLTQVFLQRYVNRMDE
jgi:hypothetical protein